MSAKWRAMQHKHRYTYNSVVFPKAYIETLIVIPPESFSFFDFFSKLRDFISLNSTYSQISAVKDLSSSFAQLLNSPSLQESLAFTAIRLYVEILFLENSFPLHRTLISPLTKNKKFLSVICSCFVALCKEHTGLGTSVAKRFLVPRAVLSLLGYPKLGFLNEVVEKCSVLVVSDIVSGFSSVILDVKLGFRPSPLAMEQCQDALSCLYYLLQRYPQSVLALENGFWAPEEIIGVILRVLKSSAFSRDCLVAAGVSFCAAIQARIRAQDVSLFLSKAVFDLSFGDGDILELAGNLCLEIRDLSILSRLCLLRGILTAVSRSTLNLLFKSVNGGKRTLLYNAILPELCKYCEKPIDSHFNFHALTVLQICLQQMKTSIMVGLTDISGDYDPLPEEMTGCLLRIIWNNLEDPLSQTVKQVHLIFDLLLDVKSSLPSKDANENNITFLCNIALDLLRLGSRCKGKYAPLASIGKRLGSNSLLKLNPNLLSETIYGYIDDDVCCAVTSFLKFFFECLRDECWGLEGIEGGYETFRKICLHPIMQGLVSGNSKLRTNLNTYALPVLLEIDPDSIFPMLSFISVGHSLEDQKLSVDLKIDSCVAALVSLLKVSRTLALIEGDIDVDSDSSSEPCSCSFRDVAIVCFKGTNVRIPVDWLMLALTHADESLRIDAAESLFLNPKTASLPSCLELKLMREAIPLNMRCSSTAFQMKWTSLFRKFFSRVRTALERQVKHGRWKHTICNGGSHDSISDLLGVSVIHRAEDLLKFMKWFSSFLFYSCYPSAPYERKTMAMELILVMIDVWPPRSLEDNYNLYPYSEMFTSENSTLLLVGSIIDSWDKLRENSFRILLCFPTPLTGISSYDTLNKVVLWAKRLVCSPRVRECDAGALTLRLIFRKYVMDLRWGVECFLKSTQIYSRSELMNNDSSTVMRESPLVAYITALIDWLRILVENGEKNLSEACHDNFVHGVLLTLRYTFEELDWSSEEVMSSSKEIKCLLQNLLELITRVTSLALWVVSSDAWYMPYDMDDVIDEASFVPDSSVGMEPVESSLGQLHIIEKANDKNEPADHTVMVGCWLAMKEVSLLLGTIIRKVPLPSCSLSESSKYDYLVKNGEETEEGLLNSQQLESIGSHFLQVLLKMKHNGAIDKTRAGFIALCNRLLCSNNPRLCKMTETWMEQLMERTTAKDQTVDDLLRRSAGIPAAFIAFFLSEPEGTPKLLLPKALSWLISVAKRSLCNDSKVHNQNNEVLHSSLVKYQDEANGCASKIRDEGVIPTVHAFNVLRASFNDTDLAADTSGFCAEALIVTIRSFSSPHWEVRNSSCLAFTALVRRMIGYLNVHKRESSRRALTGLEFFHRYPALHPFFCSELEIATKPHSDEYATDADLNIAKAVHPSLCPILVLLSMLKPPLISSGADDLLDPFMLIPFIRSSGTQSNFRVRVLAAKALIGLVSNEKLQAVINETAHCLPCERQPRMRTSFSFNSIHGILLQLSSLLDNNCKNLTDDEKKEGILSEVFHALVQCSWIGSIRSCPCPMLNSSYLLVLDQINGISLSFSSRHAASIQTLLLKLAIESLNEKNISSPPLYDPTMVDLRKQAATSYFNCLFSTDKEAPDKCSELSNTSAFNLSKMPSNVDDITISELQERIVSYISDSMYEVRIIALKKLLQIMKCMSFNGRQNDDRSGIFIWVKTDLQVVLMQFLSKEENPKCIYYILKLIFSCSVLQSNVFADWNAALCFWGTLVHLKDTVRRVKTLEILLCCMAICTKAFAKMIRRLLLDDQPQHPQEETTRAFKYVNYFIILIKQQSAPSQPVSTRKAAAEAVAASGLLEEAIFLASHVSNNCILSESESLNEEEIQVYMPEFVNLYATRILDVWFTCIQLLEDEDASLRHILAKNVQKFIDFNSFGVARQVDQVIELSLGFLSKIFTNWYGFVQYLLRYVLMAADSVSFCGDLVRKIFEKEIDNHHEEKLLICQICCFHLEKIVLVWRSERIDKLLQSWMLRFLKQLIWVADGFLVAEGDKDWIGGIGNHKDAFMPLYALLLVLYVLSKSIEDFRNTDELYISKFFEFKKIMRPFLQNPLISNLYFMLIGLHERLELEECHSSWGDFNPFFLLR